jgi:hypothetical protein
MNDPHRPRREDPARTGPHRAWSGIWRQTDVPGGNARGAAEAWSDVVTEGVELGYRVIEEQIRLGQRVAQQINTRTYGAGPMTNDAREMFERLLGYYTTMTSLWLRVLGSLVGAHDLLRGLDELRRPYAEPAPDPRVAPAAAPAAASVATSIEILAAGPTHVQLELRPGSDTLLLATPELRALGPTNPPLRDVAFQPGAVDRPMRLRIRVPDGPPPDTYYGVVVDTATGRAQGTLSVRVPA